MFQELVKNYFLLPLRIASIDLTLGAHEICEVPLGLELKNKLNHDDLN